MRSSLLLAVLAVPQALAFPWLRPEGLDALLSHPEAQKEIRRKLEEYEATQSGKVVPRQLNTGLINGVTTLLGGTLKAVLDPVIGLIPTNDAVKGLKRFPERKYTIWSVTHIDLTSTQQTTLSSHLAQLTREGRVLA